jgi:Uma2 family endonuclease
VPRSDDVKAAVPRLKLTYDDLVLFPDDGKRHELIDGEHYVTAAPNLWHQQLLGRLHLLIGGWLQTHPIGEVLLSPLDVVISDVDVVEPDLLYVSNRRGPDIITPKHLRGAPDLVIEIASPSTRKRDETIKRHLYERSGVTEYWVVDPELDVVRIYRRSDAGFLRPIELSAEASDRLETELLPGLEIHLARLFER